MNAEEFNEWYEVGQPVFYTNDFGEDTQTVTVSPAWDIGSGDSLVKLEGKSGGYCLSRIKVMECHKL